MKKQINISRRDFMKMAISLSGGLIGAAFGIPAIAYIVSPALRPEKNQDWMRLGSLSKVELGIPKLFKVKVQLQSGWVVEEKEVAVYVLTEDGRKYLALSNICTHLGCRVRWIPDREQFFSPCHNGVFDKYGYVISGPPPRPLDEFRTKIEDGNLYIILPSLQRMA